MVEKIIAATECQDVTTLDELKKETNNSLDELRKVTNNPLEADGQKLWNWLIQIWNSEGRAFVWQDEDKWRTLLKVAGGDKIYVLSIAAPHVEGKLKIVSAWVQPLTVGMLDAVLKEVTLPKGWEFKPEINLAEEKIKVGKALLRISGEGGIVFENELSVLSKNDLTKDNTVIGRIFQALIQKKSKQPNQVPNQVMDGGLQGTEDLAALEKKREEEKEKKKEQKEKNREEEQRKKAEKEKKKEEKKKEEEMKKKEKEEAEQREIEKKKAEEAKLKSLKGDYVTAVAKFFAAEKNSGNRDSVRQAAEALRDCIVDKNANTPLARAVKAVLVVGAGKGTENKQNDDLKPEMSLLKMITESLSSSVDSGPAKATALSTAPAPAPAPNPNSAAGTTSSVSYPDICEMVDGKGNEEAVLHTAVVKLLVEIIWKKKGMVDPKMADLLLKYALFDPLKNREFMQLWGLLRAGTEIEEERLVQAAAAAFEKAKDMPTDSEANGEFRKAKLNLLEAYLWFSGANKEAPNEGGTEIIGILAGDEYCNVKSVEKLILVTDEVETEPLKNLQKLCNNLCAAQHVVIDAQLIAKALELFTKGYKIRNKIKECQRKTIHDFEAATKRWSDGTKRGLSYTQINNLYHETETEIAKTMEIAAKDTREYETGKQSFKAKCAQWLEEYIIDGEKDSIKERIKHVEEFLAAINMLIASYKEFGKNLEAAYGQEWEGTYAKLKNKVKENLKQKQPIWLQKYGITDERINEELEKSITATASGEEDYSFREELRGILVEGVKAEKEKATMWNEQLNKAEEECDKQIKATVLSTLKGFPWGCSDMQDARPSFGTNCNGQ
ncbi:MAG: hypothetical protein LBJ16_02135 [Holosporaceae bacterium]|nr:hypothetical protein [Holosporaceae bacterium]